MGHLFNTLLYQPLLNILVLFYEYIPGQDFGIAIIALTILIKLIFYPLGSKAIKSQKALAELQPKVKEIQAKYKDNKEEQGRQLIELYKKEKINPFSGIGIILIQLPVLIALYRVFWLGLSPDQLNLLYNFVPRPESISPMFLGLIDLSKSNLVMAALVGITQFFQTKMITPQKNKDSGGKDFAGQMQKQMLYFMPVFMFLILMGLPSALGLYLLTTAVFTIIQQYLLTKKHE
ncbi:MAG: YidC/Oxa1 family membrane protein insertase [bacterium]|nr:YidC/Oxa1 family membrane protein insertase [bacterium]